MFNVNGLYTVVSGLFNTFLQANPGAGRANGTQITDAWLNDVQGELLNPLTVAGVVPAANTPTQVLQALKRIFGGNRTLLTVTTTLTADNAGLVVVNAAGGNVVLTLPLNSAANGVPLEFVFMRTDTSANTITVVDAGSDTDAPGGATSLLVVPGSPLWLRGDGASVWDVVLASNGGYLKAANNLSDVASAVTALANLGAAALAGSASQQFNVAAATSANNAVNYGQAATAYGANVSYGGVGSYLLYEVSGGAPANGASVAGSSVGQTGTWKCVGSFALASPYNGVLIVRVA